MITYAARADSMVGSEVRALFSVAARPGVISLAGGMPYVSALPLDIVGELAGELIARQGAPALQYTTAHSDPACGRRSAV